MHKRAIKLKSFATKAKKNKIEAIISRYRSQVQLFIDYIWQNRDAKLDKITLASVQKVQDLSERYKSNALKQALSICKNTKLKSKPKFNGFPILDAKFVSIEDKKSSSEFDLWIKLSTLKKGRRIEIPTKKHSLFNKWIKNGTLIQGCELRPDGFIVWIEREHNANVNANLKIGIDIGMNKLITTSYGEKLGTNFNKINDKILRKQKNSKSYKRAIAEKKNYINQSVNQLPWDNLSLICYENLKSLKKGKKNRSKNLRQKQQHWSYRQVIEAVKMKAQENRVHLCYVNPAYTSQTCSACGKVAASSRVLESFCCIHCGHTQDADVNGAQNILKKGLDWMASLKSAKSKSLMSFDI